MVKGKIRRRQAGSQFQPGNKFSPSYRVAPGEETARPCHNVHSDDDYHGPELRPRPSLQKTDECEPLGNRVVNLDKMITIMNDVYRQHSASDCGLLNISLCKEHKVGLGSQLQFKCTSCGFITSKMVTYVTCPGSVL